MAGVATSANAVPIDFAVSGGSATASGFAIESTVSISPSAGLVHNFVLDAESGATTHTFDFLDISVSGVGIVAGTIEATLNFASPHIASAEGLLGGFAVILGVTSGGLVGVINNPEPIAFGDGGLFAVSFQGFYDSCDWCTSLSGTVTATVSLLRSPSASVPEPATLTLLGAGLLGLAALRRRRARPE